ncbi:MAG: ArsR/SmtB family transcription factor [Candidatus Hodarchaeales archaeon]
MSELEQRLERFLSEGRCACPSLFKHKEQLSKAHEGLTIDFQILSSWLKVIADPIRLQMLLLLRERELCACELEFILQISQPTVSYHLQKLRVAGLVDLVREGRWTMARISQKGALKWLEQAAMFSNAKI